MSTWVYYSRRVRSRLTLWLLVLATALTPLARAQDNAPQENIIHGRVLNQRTTEPIARALVTAAGEEYATFTDDHGQFEIKIVEQMPVSSNVTANVRVMTSERISTGMGNPQWFEARKPGFLPPNLVSGTTRMPSGKSSNLTIYLVPEALVIGHVEVPGTEGEVHIACELYRRTMTEGREDWQPAGTFTSWSDGEFRFSKLAAGSYKVITHEEMDRDARLGVPGAALFGYPPVYYPNTTDFSAAAPVTVRAGETAQIHLTVARRPYFPVHISVSDAPAGRPMNLSVYPVGHRSPGWSLGYNPMDQAIEGNLPNGTYTVEADALGESSGIANLVVNGRPASATLQLVPNTSITVNIHQDFKSAQASSGMAMEGANLSADEQILLQTQVMLMPVEALRRLGHTVARPVPGSQGRILTFPNVRPGSYRVQVVAGGGYAAGIESGGIDLLRQPLVVGFGGGNAPIEVTLRDDGAEVSGTVEQEAASAQTEVNPPSHYIYLLPAEESASQIRQSATWRGNSFTLAQVPPGDYLAMAFDQVMQELPYGNEEALRPLLNKGKMIHVEAGQKVNVDNLKLLSAGEAE